MKNTHISLSATYINSSSMMHCTSSSEDYYPGFGATWTSCQVHGNFLSHGGTDLHAYNGGPGRTWL